MSKEEVIQSKRLQGPLRGRSRLERHRVASRLGRAGKGITGRRDGRWRKHPA